MINYPQRGYNSSMPLSSRDSTMKHSTLNYNENFSHLSKQEQREERLKFIKPMQPFVEIDEILEVVNKSSLRLFVDYGADLKAKNFN
mmetsp:Transcript_42687/g.65502  ORF Transcript_42687/g.65502 Transcript_42687/m.65502 type:complete len:87 (-) Transcript_42687:2671-2931(-)